jgi:outer membrane protein OmpA-like peptidoglycan-associated protein
MKVSFLFTLLNISLVASNCLAQAEADIWYFGMNCGVDFSQRSPKLLTNSALNTLEGCATVADHQGKLLFYSDGITVWNRQHQIMKNGTELAGDASATQAALIVPQPKSKNIYFLFTTDVAGESDGLRYSLIDMNAEKGLGEVKEKNTALTAPTCEKVTAVLHQNRQHIWVITHPWESKSFYAYLLTEKGIQPKPIISEVGILQGDDLNNAIGHLKASPDGHLLAQTIKGGHLVEVFDFDNETGKIANVRTVSFERGSLLYGLEFSSDSRKLYASAGGKFKLYQLDLSQTNPDSIKQSVRLIAQNKAWTGALQLATDGKIYVSVFNSDYLGVIAHPNLKGADCGYQERGLSLGGRKAQFGLPNFMTSYFDDLENISRILTKSRSPVRLGLSFTKNVLFESDKAAILPQYIQELDDVIAYLNQSPEIKIEIAGHTDNEGTAEKNLVLSTNRAKAVADYIISRGINSVRIDYQGYGASKPLAPNTTPEGKAQNRRIEFVMRR